MKAFERNAAGLELIEGMTLGMVCVSRLDGLHTMSAEA